MTELVIEMPKFIASEEAASVIAKLRDILSDRGVNAYVVGGFIRDGLLGKTNNDIDIAVSGDATKIASKVAKCFGTTMVPLDEVNQIARVVSPGNSAEWHLDFAALRGSIEEDLRCRDFTINAIAIPLAQIDDEWSEVNFIDPLDGLSDLNLGIIREVSETCFQEDPVRLLRAVRFAAQLNFSIDSDTESLIKRDHELVTSISAERQRDELWRILETNKAYDSIRHLDDLELFDLIIPELSTAKGVIQPKEHYWDVFDHSVETVSEVERLLSYDTEGTEDQLLATVPWSSEISEHFAQDVAGGRSRSALLKLIGLLHDIAKPAKKTIEPDGRMRFIGHSKEGAEMATQVMERLKFSNREIRIVQLVIENHLRPGYLVKEEKPSRRAVYRYFRDTAEAGIDTLFLCLADHLAARGPMLDMAHWHAHNEITGYMLSKWFQEQATVIPPKLISGHDIINEFGLTPGPQIGVLLEIVREAQAAGEVENREEAIKLIEKHLERNQ